MRNEIGQQPANLELRMIGSHDLRAPWFDSMRAEPGVGFVIPLTRSLNTTGDLRASARNYLPDVELIPSSDGDPLLLGQQGPGSDNQVILSDLAVQRLATGPGDALQLIVSRQREGQIERLIVPLIVQQTLDPAVFGRPAALISLNLLTALEDFRDGAAKPSPGQYVFDESGAIDVSEVAGPSSVSDSSSNEDIRFLRSYPRARIYAATIDDVPRLASSLQQQNIDTVSRLAEIQAVQAIDRLLGLVFGVIAWLGIVGCAASLMGAFAANIDRKRKDLALLRLMGYGRSTLMGYVMVQACLIAIVGFVAGLMLYLSGSQVFEASLGQALPQGQYVSLLDISHLLLAFAMALVVALFVSVLGGSMAMRVEPSESLRDV
jgi:putative ABC transport system permease protein